MTELTDIILVDPIQQKYNEINEYFNGKLPNPIHEPIKFNYYLRVERINHKSHFSIYDINYTLLNNENKQIKIYKS